MTNRNTPPSWAPNAVATSSGWVDPKTKELLVAKKGLLLNEVTEVKLESTQQILGEVVIPEVTDIVAEQETTEEVKVEVATEEKKTSRKTKK